MKPRQDIAQVIRDRWSRLSGPQRGMIGGLAVALAAGYVLLWTGDAANGSATAMAVDVLAKLVIVLALIFLAGQGLRLMAGRSMVAGGRRAVDVVEVTHLANNRTLYLVSVAGKLVLLGATQQQITTLTEIEPDAAAPYLRTPFQATLRQAQTPEEHV